MIALALCAPAAVLAVDGPAREAPVRIGVAYVPSPPSSTAERLYTEEGFEADLAADIGKELGRRVELVAIGEADAAGALRGGRLDALLLRLADGDPWAGELSASAEIVPTGYESGVSVAMRSDTTIRDWPALAGRTVCVAEANRPAQEAARAAGAKLVVQRVPAQSLMRVRTGECDAAIHDAVLLDRLFGEEQWKKFSATLPAKEKTRLVLALPRTEGGLPDRIRQALARSLEAQDWSTRRDNWATNVALEIYLDQDAPDCH